MAAVPLPPIPQSPEECVRVGLSRSKRAVIVYGEAPKVHNHDSSSRKYLTIIKTICTCCDFIGCTFQMSDGVLRLVLSNTCTDPSSCIYNFAVTVANGIVKVTGQAPSVSHDSAGRFYSGDVAMLSAPVNIPSRRIKTIAKNGVIRLLIPPL
ncbi:unnamed protein product [Brassica oleracea var. botrytis]